MPRGEPPVWRAFRWMMIGLIAIVALGVAGAVGKDVLDRRRMAPVIRHDWNLAQANLRARIDPPRGRELRERPRCIEHYQPAVSTLFRRRDAGGAQFGADHDRPAFAMTV